MKISTLIIDDEKPARDLVKNYLEKYPEFVISGVCSDGFDGVKTINEMRPDVVFLDIKMPKLTGFEMLELIDHKPFIVFTTAYDEYAIKAFEQNAVDYLLKPFSRSRFNDAIDKLKHNLSQKTDTSATLDNLTESHLKSIETISRITVKSGSKIHIIPCEIIIYIEAYGDYMKIHTNDGVFVKEKTLKYYESHLEKEKFVRIHRSRIVNITEIDRIELYGKESYIAIMKNKDQLKISESGYKLLKEKLKL